MPKRNAGHKSLLSNLLLSSSGSGKAVSRSCSSKPLIQIPDEIASIPDEGWMKAVDVEDFKGPIMIIVSDDSGKKDNFLMKVEEERGNILAESCKGELLGEDGLSEEPSSVGNVLMGQTLLPEVFSFKSPFGRYLTVDSLGQVACSTEAIGPSSEWTIVLDSKGTAFRNFNGKYLSFDRESGRFRCDGDALELSEIFQVKCQAVRRKERLLSQFWEKQNQQQEHQQFLQNDTKLLELEAKESRKFQSYGKNVASASSGDLKRAAEKGNLRETLLERRIKSKHDPFC